MDSPSFSKTKIPISATPLAGKLVQDYLNGRLSDTELLSCNPSDEGFLTQLKRRSSVPCDRILLKATISRQYDELKQSGEILFDAEAHAIDSLDRDNTFTVTTGHQLQLAGGPVFFGLKILSAIATARHFNRIDPSINVVPVFWLASEDHDMPEIDHVRFKDQVFRWDTGWQGASGESSCKGINNTLLEMSSLLQPENHGAELLDLFQIAYREHHSLSLATRILVHRLFGRLGIVMLDANDHQLKRKLAPVIREELLHGIVHKSVAETISKFPPGIAPQVNPRELNLFYIRPGCRERIVNEKGRWSVSGTDISFDREGILSELDKYPERFSPNVLLRPLYQSLLLPDLAYVGGPSEIAYWLQLYGLFRETKVPFPMLLVRNMFLQLDRLTLQKMTKAGMSAEDLFRSGDELMRRKLEVKLQAGDPFPEIETSVTQEFERLEKVLVKSENTLGVTVKAELHKTIKGLHQLREKWLKAEKRKEETLKSQIDRVLYEVFPEGVFQERKVSLAERLSKYGPVLLDVWLENCEPYNTSLTILCDEGV